MELIDKIKMSVKDLDLFYGDKQALKKINMDIKGYCFNRSIWMRKINFYKNVK